MAVTRDAPLRRAARGFAAMAAIWLALPGLPADAAPHGAGATRAELAGWLDGLRANGAADVSRELSWQYIFSGPEDRRLEALSVELVGSGYSIVVLAPDGRDMRLVVARTELHTPATLERRNDELDAVARKHGVRFIGVDVASGR